jgi:hypothetical protein
VPHDVAEARIDEFRRSLGEEPAEWLKEDIRSGERDRRVAQNLANLRHSVQRLEQLKREGYSFDAEHRLVAPPKPIIPRCAESRSGRPRERRARRSASSGSRDDPDPEPEPPLGGVTDSRPSPRTCEVCGKPFTPRRRSNATLCGSTCKQRKYRRRKGARALSVTPAPPFDPSTVKIGFEERRGLHIEYGRRTKLRLETERKAALAADKEAAAAERLLQAIESVRSPA